MTSSAFDAWLTLREGADTSGPRLSQDDNGGGGTDARITADLPAGTYTIEATSAAAGVAVTGPFTLSVSLTAPGGCRLEDLGTLTGRVTRTGTLGHDCVSPNYSGELARYYSFTLGRAGEVQIDMTSSAFDAWLTLREGADISGPRLLQDDNGGGGTDARITADLPAGMYTIEATSSAAGVAVTGPFALTVSLTAPAGCRLEDLGTLTGRVTRAGMLGHDCVSPNYSGELARYYGFTLEQAGEVQIDMMSSALDAWLTLREGADMSGRSLFFDNDGGESGTTDARVIADLPAGTYTIEATSAAAGVAVTGPFTVTVIVAGGGLTPEQVHRYREGWRASALTGAKGKTVRGPTSVGFGSRESRSATFTDDSISAGATPVKAVHFQELRARIAALRAQAGLPVVQYTDPTLTAGLTPVKRVHLTELRAALDAVYDARGQPRPQYTDIAVVAGVTIIRAVHLTQVREAVAALE